jgi:hypothetical protein
VKKTTISTGCAVVSSCSVTPRQRASAVRSVKNSPPTTAAGMFRRSSHATRRRSSMPRK